MKTLLKKIKYYNNHTIKYIKNVYIIIFLSIVYLCIYGIYNIYFRYLYTSQFIVGVMYFISYIIILYNL